MAVETIRVWELEPFSPRRGYPHYLQLRDSVAGMGLVNPIVVRKLNNGLYQVIDGQWRVLAARANGMFNIPVNVVKMSDDEMIAFVTQMPVHHVRMSQEDMKKAVKALHEKHGYTVKRIAELTNISENRIRRYLK